MKYQTKPEPVEAIQWTGDNIEEISAFLREKPIIQRSEKLLQLARGYCAKPSNWIVKPLDNRYCVYTDAVFATKFEGIARPDIAALRDSERIDHLEKLIRHCPHTFFYWNDDKDAEEPVGFSISVEGCERTQVAVLTTTLSLL